MDDSEKSKEQLIIELNMLRRNILDLTADAGREKISQIMKEYENTYFSILDSSPNAICLIKVDDSKFIAVNESFTSFTGYTKEEAIGRTHNELNFWVNQDDFHKMDKNLREKGRLFNVEIKSRTKSGEIRNGLFSANIIEMGNVKFMVLIITDITEFKRIEEALRESENKLATAFRASPHALIIATMGEGKFVEANDNVCRLTGYSREELIGHTVDELKIWNDLNFRSRMAKALLEKGRIENEELDWRTRSGEVHTMLMSAEVAEIGGKKCIVASATDITYLKKIEHNLRTSEERFYKAFHSSPGIVSITTLDDGTFLEINDGFTRTFGYTREEAIGNNSLSLKIWVDPTERIAMIHQLKEQRRVSNVEYLHRVKSGEIRTFLFSAERIEFDGKPCVLAFNNDITDYKKMEAQTQEVLTLRELDRLRTELFANVSHELRTPLASIKGFTTMLIDYEKRLNAKEKREYLETIDKNTDRMVELIEQLLEMSRLGSGLLSIKKSPTDIIILCRSVVTEARVRAPEHKFTLDLPSKLPLVNMDDRRIRQVLDNVIDNSVKYSDPGSEIIIAVRKSGKEVLFSVTDHGVGISEKELPRLFQRMFHGTQKQKTGFVGAGLGLSICKGLIEAHGGKIWVESQEGVGTQCYFTLPIDAAEKTKPKALKL
jgi:PAS domain S-box-containing protein